MIKINLAFHGITLAKIRDFNYLFKHIHHEYFWFIDRYEDSPSYAVDTSRARQAPSRAQSLFR